MWKLWPFRRRAAEAVSPRAEPEPESRAVYRYPFPDNVPLNIEPDSIAHTGVDKYAVDFLVPEGTLVLAPRAGSVFAIEQCHDMGGPDEQFADRANYVMIVHSDNERSILIHLKKDSVRIKLGAYVESGDVIAAQGSSGWTYEPHIHFAVYRNGSSVKIRFAEANPSAAP